MNQQELLKLFSMIDIDYPSNKIASDENQQNAFIARWMQKLGGFDARTVYAAYESYVAKNARFAPGWQDLSQIIADSITGGGMPAEEAWGMIQAAVRKYGYTNPTSAEESLGEKIWTIVNRFGWSYFCQMPISDESIYFSQFRNAFENERKRAAERIQLSPGVINHLGSLGAEQQRPALSAPAVPNPPQQIEQRKVDISDGSIQAIIDALMEAKQIAQNRVNE